MSVYIKILAVFPMVMSGNIALSDNLLTHYKILLLISFINYFSFEVIANMISSYISFLSINLSIINLITSSSP
jgi:hypothetical protein